MEGGLRQARQKISRLLREGKTALQCGELDAALPMAREVLSREAYTFSAIVHLSRARQHTVSGHFPPPSNGVMQARALADELRDVRAQRAIVRFLARIFRAVRCKLLWLTLLSSTGMASVQQHSDICIPAAQKGEIRSSLEALQESMSLSEQLEDKSGDVDVLGAIADAYADLGDLERAGMV